MRVNIVFLVALVSGLVGCSPKKSNPIVHEPDGRVDVQYLGIQIFAESSQGDTLVNKVDFDEGIFRLNENTKKGKIPGVHNPGSITLRFQVKTYPDSAFIDSTMVNGKPWKTEIKWIWSLWRLANSGLSPFNDRASLWDSVDIARDSTDVQQSVFICSQKGYWRVGVEARDGNNDSINLPEPINKNDANYHMGQEPKAFGTLFSIDCP